MFNWLRKVFGNSSNSPQVSSDTSHGGVYSGLRHQALSATRTDFGISPLSPDLPIWGVLMESGYPEGTATLFALSDGTTSLYLSSGGGIIGGQGHENVRQANTKFIKLANEFYESFKPCSSFPIPEAEQAVFYVLTDSGILTESSLEEDFGNNRHLLSPLFYAGQEVITQLRQTTEQQDA